MGRGTATYCPLPCSRHAGIGMAGHARARALAGNNANEAIVICGSSATACAPVQQQEREPVSPACYTALEALYSYSKTGCEPTAAAAPSGCVRQCAPQQQNSRTKYVRGAVPRSPCQSLSTAGVQVRPANSWQRFSSFLCRAAVSSCGWGLPAWRCRLHCGPPARGRAPRRSWQHTFPASGFLQAVSCKLAWRPPRQQAEPEQ